MNRDLESALATYRWWRDVGNDLLLFGVLLEFMIDALWTATPDVFPLLRGKRATQPLIRWYAHFLTLRGMVVFLVGFVVFLGIAIERIEGARADQAVDRIRANLQRTIVMLSPRAWLVSGAEADKIIIALSQFRGQRIDLRIGPGAPEVAVQQEPIMFAVQIAGILHAAGWLGPDGHWSSMLAFKPRGANIEGIVVEVAPNAPAETRAAAILLRNELSEEQLRIWPTINPIARNPSGDSASTIVLTIGNM